MLGGGVGVLEVADGGPVAEDQAAGHVDVADQPVPHVVDGLAHRLRAAELHAVLDDPAMLLGRLDHLPPFVDVVAPRLLDVHVLARLAGPDRRQGVPVVGRRDADHVDVLAVEDAAEVGLGLGLVAVLGGELLGPLGKDLLVGVAEHGDLDALRAHEAARCASCPAR